jgi:hypothetical protein
MMFESPRAGGMKFETFRWLFPVAITMSTLSLESGSPVSCRRNEPTLTWISFHSDTRFFPLTLTFSRQGRGDFQVGGR